VIARGDIITLVPDKPAAGGRMLARHEGLVVLVAGAIPGERVRVRIERVERSLAFGLVEEVVDPHPARRPVTVDPRCGGAVYTHIAYEEQCRLKSDVIRDALVRLGRMPAPASIPIAPSPERGYRMRARLHLRGGRVGFFLEGTHQVCDAAMTGQLLPAATRAVLVVAESLAAAGLRGGADLDLSENRAGDERAVHIELSPEAAIESPGALGEIAGVTGLAWSKARAAREQRVYGRPFVEDTILDVRLRRHARAFFQGNRFLLDELVNAVTEACLPGNVVDLYAGVGLFGVCLAATGRHRVIAVEEHAASAADLRANAEPFGDAIRVEETRVERFVAAAVPAGPLTLVLDPPRTGMTREAADGATALGASRVVFVSCDVATFARDVRKFADAGYRLESVRGFDLFPATAHVEALAVLSR
jgi:tRNA/tmRNA/rRNA uracil-C5-methylase (TrmA/RlmC/RlmD family)